MHLESDFNARVDEQRNQRSRQADGGDEAGATFDNQAAGSEPSFDMEETADIVLPFDHPIFRRKPLTRSDFGD